MITETYDTDRSFSLYSYSAFHEVLGRFLGAVGMRQGQRKVAGELE
jgi:hypothetical protein